MQRLTETVYVPAWVIPPRIPDNDVETGLLRIAHPDDFEEDGLIGPVSRPVQADGHLQFRLNDSDQEQEGSSGVPGDSCSDGHSLLPAFGMARIRFGDATRGGTAKGRSSASPHPPTTPDARARGTPNIWLTAWMASSQAMAWSWRSVTNCLLLDPRLS